MFDLSNAQVAKILGAKVVIVTQGGIGRPIDEVCLNRALFEREGVEVVGVIVNKVTSDKYELVSEFVRKGLKRKGLELLGVLPYQRILCSPSLFAIQADLRAESLNDSRQTFNLVDDVIIGAMTIQNAMRYFHKGVLVITPGDREDIILAAAAGSSATEHEYPSGIILTGDLRPSEGLMKIIRGLPFPVLLAKMDSYEVASHVHDMIVKTHADETEKITLIRDLIAKHVDVSKLLASIR